LKYSLTDVKLYITPSAAATQASINGISDNLSNAVNLQSNLVNNVLGNDCAVFGPDGACVSVSAGVANAASGDLYNGGLTLGKKINDNWRFGVFTNSAFNNPTVGSINQTNDPTVGGFVTWSKDRLSIQASAATGRGTMTVTRDGPETGVGKSNVDSQAYQLRANYAIPVTETVTVTPYVGIRRTESNYSGYTETGPVFPLTVDATARKTTDAIAGVSVSKQFTERLSGNLSVGFTQRLKEQNPVYAGTSEIGGLSTFSNTLPGNGVTNAAIGGGFSYSVDKTTRVGVNFGIQQRGNNANINSVGISITKGF
jgi:Autotransporter beta-domain